MTTKLLIVDDSALMRRHLTKIFDAAGGFDIRTARDGLDALRELREFDPDVITLDINMPQMDGMTCLSQIMVESPRPVVMLSSLTHKDALVTLEALALGAVDYVPKPGGTVSRDTTLIERVLIDKVRSAVRARVRGARPGGVRPTRTSPKVDAAVVAARRAPLPLPLPSTAQLGSERVVLMGVSTGGPRALEDVLPKLPAEFPYAVLVSIHMPAAFTGYFARRMDELCALKVEEVARQSTIEPGRVYIAKGETDMVVSRRAGALVALPAPADPKLLWHPSVERMVTTTLSYVQPQSLIAVQLTGMGHDGAEAMATLRKRGGHTIAESEETAIVFGMPKELIARGGAECVLPIDRIAAQLESWAEEGSV